MDIEVLYTIHIFKTSIIRLQLGWLHAFVVM